MLFTRTFLFTVCLLGSLTLATAQTSEQYDVRPNGTDLFEGIQNPNEGSVDPSVADDSFREPAQSHNDGELSDENLAPSITPPGFDQNGLIPGEFDQGQFNRPPIGDDFGPVGREDFLDENFCAGVQADYSKIIQGNLRSFDDPQGANEFGFAGFPAGINDGGDIIAGQRLGYMDPINCKVNFISVPSVDPDLISATDQAVGQIQKEIALEGQLQKDGKLQFERSEDAGDGLLYSGAEIDAMLAQVTLLLAKRRLLIDPPKGANGKALETLTADQKKAFLEKAFQEAQTALSQQASGLDPQVVQNALSSYQAFLSQWVGSEKYKEFAADFNKEPKSANTPEVVTQNTSTPAGVQSQQVAETDNVTFDPTSGNDKKVEAFQKLSALRTLLLQRKRQLDDREEAAEDAGKDGGGGGGGGGSPEQSPTGGAPSGGGGGEDGGSPFEPPFEVGQMPQIPQMVGLMQAPPGSESDLSWLKRVMDENNRTAEEMMDRLRGRTTQLVAQAFQYANSFLNSGAAFGATNEMFADSGSRLPVSNQITNNPIRSGGGIDDPFQLRRNQPFQNFGNLPGLPI